jgi:hypothetical protein
VAYFLGSSDEAAADFIDLAFQGVSGYYRQNWDGLAEAQRHLNEFGARAGLDEAVQELNECLRRGGIDLQFIHGQLVRTDSPHLKHEAVEPAFELLEAEGFSAAIREFGHAHEHFRHGRLDSAMTDANRAFESSVKHVLELEGSGCASDDSASELVRKLELTRFCGHPSIGDVSPPEGSPHGTNAPRLHAGVPL